MKKLLNIIGLSTVLLMASCDMDRSPMGYTNPDEMFNDIQSIEAGLDGAYAALRNNYSPANMIVADVQADYVNALYGFSNNLGDIYTWNAKQDNAEMTAVWNSCYVTIAQCNFMLDGVAPIAYDTSDKDLNAKNARLDAVRGRLYLMRAMSYSVLAERFCKAYNVATAKDAFSGVPLITEANNDPDNKPVRATLFDVYDQILKDLVTSEDYFKKAMNNKNAQESLKTGIRGAANAVYLSEDCISALRAHVYLQMGLYNEAYTAADALIKKTTYSLATSLEEFQRTWIYDTGNEIIFKFAASKEELPAQYGISFYSENFGHTKFETDNIVYWSVDYLPTQDFVNKFSSSDYRKSTWFYTGARFGGVETCWTGGGMIVNDGYTMISKFPGNPDLRTDKSWNFMNTWKVFRLSEMYLIAIEASLNGAEGDALTIMNTLRQARGLAALEDVTMDILKEERYKELMMEGYRISDLKRWGDGMKRGKAQSGTISKLGPRNPDGSAPLIEVSTGDLSIPMARELEVKIGDANAYRFVWPIPFSEIYANQNLAQQQNPGWTN